MTRPLFFISFFLSGVFLSAQDSPCDAIQLECDLPPITGTFDGLSQEAEYPMGCGESSQGTVWFTFESVDELSYLFYSDSEFIFDGVNPRHWAKLYTGETCDSLIEVEDCTPYKYFKDFYEPGTYYVQVSRRFFGAQDNFFSAGVLCSEAPVNDAVCDALPLEFGESYTGSLVGATNTNETGLDGGDVWYKFEADSSKTYHFFGRPGQRIRAYLAPDSCSDLVYLTGGEDILGLVAEETVYISIYPDNYQANILPDYQFTVFEFPLVENGFACDATPLEGSEGSFTGTFNGAPSDFQPCGAAVGVSPSRWYKFSSEVGGELDFSVCGYDIWMYSGFCDDLECSEVFGVRCPSDPFTVVIEPNVNYFIRIAGTSGEYELSYSFTASEFCPGLGYVGNPCSSEDPGAYDFLITEDCECEGTPFPLGTHCTTAFSVDSLPYSASSSNGQPCNFYFGYGPCDNYTEADIPSPPDGDVCQNGLQDYLWEFTPANDIIVDLMVTDVTGEVFTPSITVLTGCPFETNVAQSDCPNFSFSNDLLGVELSGGTTYYILVGTQGGLSFDFYNATLTIELSNFCEDLGLQFGATCDDEDPSTVDDIITEDCECVGTPLVEGSVCENALVVEQLPYFVEDLGTFDDNSTSHANNYGNTEALMSVILDNSEYYNCSFGAFDYVFQYTPDEDIVVDMEYMAIASLAYEPSIHLYKGCPFEEWIASSCAGPTSLTFCGSFFGCDYLYDRLDAVYLEGGEEYFIMIDGWNAEGPNHVFDFSISESTIIPGDFCQEAVELTPGLNWNDHFLEIDLADAHISGGTCTDLLSRPDKWFYFDAVSPTMIAGVQGIGEFDPVIEAYAACGSEPGRCKNATGAGEIEFVADENLQVGERYYLRVYDTRSFDPDNDQDFKISVRYFDLDNSEITVDPGSSSLFEDEFQWDVYPNPNSGNELYLRVDHIPEFKESIRFSIYDLVGRELKTEWIRIDGSNFVFRMAIDDLTRGAYAVVVTGQSGMQSSKILIIE